MQGLGNRALTGTLPTQLGTLTATRTMCAHCIATSTLFLVDATPFLTRWIGRRYLHDNSITGTLPTEMALMPLIGV